MADFADQASEASAAFLAERLAARSRTVCAVQVKDPQGRVLCVDCGEPILLARLAVLPGATRCVECQQEIEEAK